VLYTLAKLSAYTCPIFNTIKIYPEPFFLPTGDWIKKTNPFNPSSITLVAAIRYHNVIEGPLLGTASCQSDFYHYLKPFYQWSCQTKTRSMPHGHGPCSLILPRRCLPQLFNPQLHTAGLRKPGILTPFALKENNSLQVFL